MPKKDDDLNKFFKAMKNSEGDYPEELEKETRRKFIRKILLNKYFWFIVFFLVMVILCALASVYGVRF